eukprot:COSAG06_NODE_4403_length_4293_cov_27.038251_3_plen_107_part_00
MHAGRCVEIEPSYRKGWLRLGAACLRLHDASIARGAAERGLAQQSDTTDNTAVTKQLKGKSKISLNHSSCRPQCQANLPPNRRMLICAPTLCVLHQYYTQVYCTMP